MGHLHPIVRFVPCFFLVLVSGTTAPFVFVERSEVKSIRGAEVWGYDPAKGTAADEIDRNFNLHRGHWWNYYERGSWHLAYGHYRVAERDFRTVVDKRPTDTRDARTYGMHFKDCFGHRELGIALYHLGIQPEKKNLELLQDAREHLCTSLRQAKSARAEFFRTLVEEVLWEERDDKDTTAPEITVENATAAGKNWAVVCSNREIVQLDIRVTDHQSGVKTIWVDEDELIVERSGPEVRQTVYVPINLANPLIWIRATDLVGNGDGIHTTVKVELDRTPPTILTMSDAAQMTPDGFVSVACSARDDLGLVSVHVNSKRIDCGCRRESDVRVKIPFEPGQSRVKLQATDVAGNTTTGYADILSIGNRTVQPMPTGFRFAEPTDFRGVFPALHTVPGVPLDLPGDSVFSLAAVRTAANHAREIRLENPGTRKVVSVVRRDKPSPGFEFENYTSQPGGFPVTTAEYRVDGKLKYGTGVKWIEVDGNRIEVEPSDNADAIRYFCAPVRLPHYGEKRVVVKALAADGSQVGDASELVFQRVRDTAQEQDSLYSIIALPAVPDGIRDNLCPMGLYTSMRDAVVRCPLDESDPDSPPRFNCVVMKQLGPDTIRIELGDPVSRARPLGRKHKVDLSICGRIRKNEQDSWEITVDLLDNETGRIIYRDADRIVPSDQRSWPVYMSSLVKELKGAIPRVSGRVTEVDPLSKRICFDVGQESRLFPGQKLCVFERETATPHAGVHNRLAEATVRGSGKGSWSEAWLATTDRGEYPLKAFRESQLVIMTK